MISRVFLACLFSLLLVGCAMRPQATVYTCEDATYARHRLILHPNKRFVVNLVPVNKNGDRISSKVYGGYYRQNFYGYDLKFDTLSKAEIKNIFQGSVGFFLPNSSIYRITKASLVLFVGKCHMRREG